MCVANSCEEMRTWYELDHRSRKTYRGPSGYPKVASSLKAMAYFATPGPRNEKHLGKLHDGAQAALLTPKLDHP